MYHSPSEWFWDTKRPGRQYWRPGLSRRGLANAAAGAQCAELTGHRAAQLIVVLQVVFFGLAFGPEAGLVILPPGAALVAAFAIGGTTFSTRKHRKNPFRPDVLPTKASITPSKGAFHQVLVKPR